MKWASKIFTTLWLLALAGCAASYPLGSVAKRASDPQFVRHDVQVDTTGREIRKIRRVAWVSYAADFSCESDCPFTIEERKKIAREVAEKSFAAFDREIRKALGDGRTVLSVDDVTRSKAISLPVRTDSFKSTIARWFDRMGLSRSTEVIESAQGLKTLNPNEIGWSGGESLAAVGRALGADGVLVGRLEISLVEKNARELMVRGPTIWLFSSTTAHAVAVAGLRPSWKLEPISPVAYDWGGLDDMAAGYSRRVAQEMH